MDSTNNGAVCALPPIAVKFNVKSYTHTHSSPIFTRTKKTKLIIIFNAIKFEINFKIKNLFSNKTLKLKTKNVSRNCPAGIYSSDRIRKIISYIFKGFSGDGVASSSFLPLFFYVDTRSFQPQKKKRNDLL